MTDLASPATNSPIAALRTAYLAVAQHARAPAILVDPAGHADFDRLRFLQLRAAQGTLVRICGSSCSRTRIACFCCRRARGPSGDVGGIVVPLFLFAGLATRLATLPLLGMVIVIQVLVYPQAWVEHLLWASALVVLLTRGPGVLSLDHLIERRLAPQKAD